MSVQKIKLACFHSSFKVPEWCRLDMHNENKGETKKHVKLNINSFYSAVPRNIIIRKILLNKKANKLDGHIECNAYCDIISSFEPLYNSFKYH